MVEEVTSQITLPTPGPPPDSMLQWGNVLCAPSSILILIASRLPAGHRDEGQAPGTVCGRNATLRLGVRRGTVDAHLKVVTAVCGHLAGVKYSVNSRSHQAVGSNIVVRPHVCG